MIDRGELQEILGVDKRNPYYTVYRSTEDSGKLFVFLGSLLFEVVKNDKESMQFKLLIARLYNSHISTRKLTSVFGISHRTMKKWGDAVKSGDPYEVLASMRGRNSPKKLTTEAKAFVRHRFTYIYEENKYSYSSVIREELKEIFNIEVSGETLRPIFTELKKKRNQNHHLISAVK
jgi:transposase